MEHRRKFCSKHSFYFRAIECPFCLKERINRFIPKEDLQPDDRPATEIELKALIEKFKKL